MATVLLFDPREIILGDGTRCFSDPDINECRAWLRRAGLEIDRVVTHRGWHDGKGRCGILDFHQGKWCASHYWSAALKD